jgi:hypothetical protein
MSRRAEDSPIEVTLPITPMLDMSFQLLFFFIVTFNPSKEASFPYPLLMDAPKQASDPKNIDPLVKPKEKPTLPIPAALTIKIRKETEGFTVSLSPGGDSDNFSFTSTSVDDEDGRHKKKWGSENEKRIETLTERLKVAYDRNKETDKDGKVKSPTVSFEVRPDVRWADMVIIRDACLQAGFRDFQYNVPAPA